MLRQQATILWKSYVIRKRHWLLTIAEIVIPIVLFFAMAYGRAKMPEMTKVYVNESEYHDVKSMYSIYADLNVAPLKLWYAPYSDNAEAIIKRIQIKLGIPSEVLIAFESIDELLSYKNFTENSVVAAVIFHEINELRLDYDLTIYNKYLNWNTDKLFLPIFTSQETKTFTYLKEGFAALQIAIDTSFVELLMKPEQTTNISINLQQFPDPPHIEDSKLNQLFMHFLPIITIFSFIFLCPAVLQSVGEEKASGTKELMKMVGLKSSQIWFGWLIYALMTLVISIPMIVVFMKVPFWGVSYSLIEHSDGTVLFMFLFLYCMSAITLCFLIANIFQKPSIATIFGIVFWIISYFVPQIFVTSCDFMLWRFKVLFGVLPNMALYYGYSAISVYEMREIGIQWYNLFEPGTGADQDITMGQVFVMLIVDTITFMLLTLYIENVNPGQYGIPKSYIFPLKAAAKFVKQCVACDKSEKKFDVEVNGPLLNTGIQINSLKKIYCNRVAVDDLNMDIRQNAITVLLGENGAGKTTTMSILTGMINASSGSLLINGQDINNNTAEVRRKMGLCPQHNLVFDNFTVYEHLYFFAMLKGCTDIDSKIEEILKKIDLDKKKNCMPHTLSGGMKRKLCLAMALIGDSQVLILDEPTSGMDLQSRRKVWKLLLEYKISKTILISTHFMEEAEAIGDRIAIMANGRLQCDGTPAQLKAQYNTGYNLSLFLGSDDLQSENSKLLEFSNKSISDIRKTITNYFPSIRVKQQTNDSVVYLLPFDKNGRYSTLLEQLEEDKRIKNININATTLNDVFLKAKDENDGYVGDIGYRLCILLKSKQKILKLRATVILDFPQAKVIRENNDSVIYFLPNSGTMHNKTLLSLIDKLTEQQNELNITNVTVNVTTSKNAMSKSGQLRMYTSEDGDEVYHLCIQLKSKRCISLIKKTVKEFISKVKEPDEYDNYLLYWLPLCNDEECRRLIAALELEMDNWDIFSINMSTTPNGVFLKVEDDKIDETDEILKDELSTFRTWNNFLGLLRKRGHFFKHTFWWLIPAILVSMVIFSLVIVLSLSNNNIFRNSEPYLDLSLEVYGRAKVLHGTNSSSYFTNKLSKIYSKSVLKANGIPTSVNLVSEGIIGEGTANLIFYKEHMIAAAEFITDAITNQEQINAMYSSDALHGIPISINLVTNTLVKTLVNENVSISIRNTPLKPLSSQIAPSELSVLNVTSLWLMLLPISFFIFGSIFIVFPHSEVSTNFIKLQTNAGVSKQMYWFTNMVFDIILSLVSLGLIVLLLYLINLLALDSNPFQSREILAISAILGLYIAASLPFTYLFSYKKTITSGIALFFILGIFTGIVPTIVISAMEISIKNNYNYYLKLGLNVLSPQFALSNLSVKFSKKFVENFNWKYMDPNKRNHICNTEPHPCCQPPWSATCERHQDYFLNKDLGIVYDLQTMLGSAVFYFIILLFLNKHLSIRDTIKYYLWPRKSNKDTSDYIFGLALQVKNLSKTIAGTPIVDKLGFHLMKNKCLGLLGVNGAGKTTTFRMLTKYMLSDGGDVKLYSDDKPLEITTSKYSQKIGYCPQDNCVNFYLTGRELLNTTAMLKGASWEETKTITDILLKKFDLTKHADKQYYQYSGGNKRRLNASLAFLGSPEVIFLDEPTSGVDPASQRKFWKILSSFKKSNTSFLLCSHSTEECENLSDDIMIMKGGKTEEQGSSAALKKKYQGQKTSKITIRLKFDSEKKIDVMKKVNNLFKLREQGHRDTCDTILVFELSVKDIRLSGLFSKMEELQAEFPEDIEHVLFDDMSLEDVLLKIGEQNKANEKEKKEEV